MAKKEVKLPKLPKSLGQCVDKYVDAREARLAEGKVVAEMETVEKYIKEHIIQNLPKGDTGVAGTAYRATAYNDVVYQVKHWPKLYKHILKMGEDGFALLNRVLNQAAVKDIVDSQVRPSGKRGETWKPKLPPGIEPFTVVKLSVTKK